jgi:hypothetical protein
LQEIQALEELGKHPESNPEVTDLADRVLKIKFEVEASKDRVNYAK